MAAKKAKRRDVDAEVRRVEQRVSATEDVMRFMHRIRRDSLAKAEKLRKLARAAIKDAYGARTIAPLEAFVEKLPRFVVPVKLPAKLARSMNEPTRDELRQGVLDAVYLLNYVDKFWNKPQYEKQRRIEELARRLAPKKGKKARR